MKKVMSLSTIIIGGIIFFLNIMYIILPTAGNLSGLNLFISNLFKSVLSTIQFILFGSLCFVLFAFAILLNKEKFLKTITIILFISLILGCIFTLGSGLFNIFRDIYYIFKYESSISDKVFITELIKTIISTILLVISDILVIVMVYGIYKKKKLPYLTLGIIKIILVTLSTIISIVLTITLIKSEHVVLSNSLLYYLSNIFSLLFTISIVGCLYYYSKDLIKE